MKDLKVEEMLKTDHFIPVDVRSPVEFLEGSIPGAVNIPLFSDEERKEIGTIYKKVGKDAAMWLAMEMVSPRIPAMLSEIKHLSETNKSPIIHCWRGGMRSRAVATFMEFAGLPATRLEGGYKAYRQYSLEQIPKLMPERAIVLHGKTGIGKTEMLRALKNKGYQVLDLEEMAHHRGSIFGTIGIGDGYNQKRFDANLYTSLASFRNKTFFLMEAESKRIGRIIQPDVLLEKKAGGIHLYASASLETRVERIYQEYVVPFRDSPTYVMEVKEKLEKLKKRIKIEEIKHDLENLLRNEDYKQIISLLLVHYYDPRYDHKRLEYHGDFIDIDANDIDQGVMQIENILTNLGYGPEMVKI